MKIIILRLLIVVAHLDWFSPPDGGVFADVIEGLLGVVAFILVLSPHRRRRRLPLTWVPDRIPMINEDNIVVPRN